MRVTIHELIGQKGLMKKGSLSQVADDTSWPWWLHFSVTTDYNTLFVMPPFRTGLLIPHLRKALQHVMSLVTEICGDHPKLKQKIPKLGQRYRFLPFWCHLNDLKEGCSILITFCYIPDGISCWPQENSLTRNSPRWSTNKYKEWGPHRLSVSKGDEAGV